MGNYDDQSIRERLYNMDWPKEKIDLYLKLREKFGIKDKSLSNFLLFKYKFTAAVGTFIKFVEDNKLQDKTEEEIMILYKLHNG